MELIINSTRTLKKLFEAFEEAGLKTELKSKNSGIVELNTSHDIDIMIAYLSRYFFTNTFHIFDYENNLSSSAASVLKKDFRGLIEIRKNMLNYLRSGNKCFNIDKFIKFNLVDINDTYQETLLQFSLNTMNNEIAGFLYDSPYQSISQKIKAKIMYAFSLDNFFVILTDKYDNEIFVITQHNYNNFARAVIFNKIKEIEFSGIYNQNIINDIYKKFIETDHFNIKFNLEKLTIPKEITYEKEE